MSEIDVLVESIPAGPLSELDQQRLRDAAAALARPAA
jgi:hypothetical protein